MDAPLQILLVVALVTAGVGFTVTVMVLDEPIQEPVLEVGVTIYSTLPALALLGLVNVWLMIPPEAAIAPLTLPTMVPIVQL